MRTLNALILSIVLVGACSGIQSPIGDTTFVTTDTIDDSYTTGGGRFDSGPAVYVVAKAKEHQGATVLCAIWTNGKPDAASQNYIDAAVDGLRIEIDGQTLVDGVRHFPHLEFKGDVAGSQADCMTTELPWQPQYSDTPVEIVARLFLRRKDRETIVRFAAAPLPRLTDGSVPPPNEPVVNREGAPLPERR